MNKTIEIFENVVKNIAEAINLLDIELPKHNGWLAKFKNNEIESLKSINENFANTVKELKEFEKFRNDFESGE